MRDRNARVPKLRFPKFRDAGAWEEKRLGGILTIGNGRDYKHLGKGDVPVYGSGGYMLSVDEYLYDGKSACIGRKGTINNPIFLSGKFWTVDTLFYTHSFKECLPFFAFLIFQNIDWLSHNEAGGVPSLSKKNIEKIQFAIPSPPEQQKIATCLTSLDDLITAQAQKAAVLKAHKKGLMQQLFPAEGETQPRLRFPEFRDAGAWQERRLGDVVQFLDGQRKPIKESDRAAIKGEYPYYGASGIIDYIDDYIFDEDLILLGEDGENIVSRNLPLVFKISGKCWVNNHAHVMKPKRPNHLEFLVQYLESLSYVKYNSGGAQPKLNQAVCKTIPLLLPSPPEQQEIADCLTSVDDLIRAQSQKIDALKAHKKGLMQQLFPAADGVNG